MKANRFARRSEDGVSTVLGGILVFSLVIIFLIMVRTEFAPRWQEEDEAQHMSAVGDQIAVLRAEADRQASNLTNQPVQVPISLLERQTSRLLSPPNLPASLSFATGGSIEIGTSEMRVFESGGRSLLGIDEDWTNVGGSPQLTDVEDVHHLRIRIVDPEGADDGNHVDLTITDADSQFAGRLRVYIQEFLSGYAVNVLVQNAAGVTIYDQGESTFQQHTPPFHWTDALAPELHFIDVLAAAAKPATLDWTEVGITGSFTVTYVDGGGAMAGNSGSLVSDFERTVTSGKITFEGTSQEFVQQDIHLEAGAVIVTQAEGHAMRTDPVFTVRVAGGQASISMNVPGLSGSSHAITTNGMASVLLESTSSNTIRGTSPDWSVKVPTTHPALWADMWTRHLESAGLTAAADHFSITTDATSASLTVYGPTTDPNSTVHDMNIELHHAVVDVRLQT